MKRRIFILFLSLVLTLMLLILSSCGGKNEKTDAGSADSDSAGISEATPDPAPEKETDPPVITTEDPGPKIKRDEVQLFDTPDHDPVSANGAGISIGMYFKTNLTLLSISFECPSWNDDIGQMTLDLYKWNTDYETTIAGSPIFTETDLFTDYPDNATIEVELPENLCGPGEYLYTFRDGKDGVGMWKSKDDFEGVQSYFKGNPVSGAYKTYLYGWYYVD